MANGSAANRRQRDQVSHVVDKTLAGESDDIISLTYPRFDPVARAQRFLGLIKTLHLPSSPQ